MPHVRHRLRRLRPGSSRPAVSAVLLSVSAVAFAGLVTVAPSPADDAPDVLALTAEDRVLPAPDAPVVERSVSRASRSRRIAERAAAEEAARVAAEAQAKAEAEAAARARAAAEAAAQAKARAEAAAKAKAAAEAKAKARAAARSGAAVRAGGRCPVPDATFSDTWGAARSGGRSHKGTDLLAPYGSPVYAVAAGRVRTAYSANGGISLYLDADNGETYFYAHNASNVAGDGQRVAAGDLVARVGSTGNAGSTNHVHFERVVGGRAVNPYAFLRRLCG